MVVLRAIGGFFARIGRWIKETAWIQPLLIVGAIFAIIFSIPQIIKVINNANSESDNANKFFAKYQLSLKNANKIPDGKFTGTSEVDEFLTYIEDGETDKVKAKYGERFFVAFVKDDSSCQDLYGGLKTFRDKWSKKDKEFVGESGKDLEGKFKLYTVYTDSTTIVDDEEINLFDRVWLNHYQLFETMSSGGYLDKTWYAMNQGYDASEYEKNFTSDKLESCPMNTPLVMYFDYADTEGKNNIKPEDQKVKGLSDVVFTVNGSSDLERARTLKNCWSHADRFGKIVND